MSTVCNAVGLTYPLEDLLSPDVLQPAVQILHFLYQGRDLVLVGAFNLARLANGHVEGELDGAVDVAAQPPAPALYVLRRDADAVLARVGGAEGEAARVCAALGYDAVVVVKGFLDRHKDTDVGFGLVGLGGRVEDFGVVVAWQGGGGLVRCVSWSILGGSIGTNYQCVLGQFLKEALLNGAVHEKV